MSTIKLRRDTAANWLAANPVLSLAEPGLETDTNKIKYGDGTSHWGDLPYAGGGTGNTLVNGSYTVSLGADGTTTFPTGGHIGATKGGTMLDAGYGYNTSLTTFYANANYAACVTGDAGTGTLRITAYNDGGPNPASEWAFANDGILTFPSGMTIGTILNTEGIQASGNTQLGLISQGAGGASVLEWVDDLENPTLAAVVAVNSLFANPGAVQIITGNVGPAPEHAWTFDADGNLTLPQGSTIGETTTTTVISPPGALAGQSLVIRPTTGIFSLSTDHPGGFVPGSSITITTTQVYTAAGTLNYTFTGATSGQLGRATTGTLVFNNNDQTSALTWTVPAQTSMTTFTFTLVSGTGFGGVTGLPISITVTLDGAAVTENSHIHLISGNPTTVDLYLGDDDQYVKIEKNGGNVVIGTDTNAHQWTFDTTGDLTFPDGSIQTTAYTGSGTADANVWVQTFVSDTPLTDFPQIATSVEYDSDGNVIGLFNHFDDNNGASYFSVGKYTPSGTRIWTARLSDDIQTDGWGLAVDSVDGWIYVAGQSDGVENATYPYNQATLTKIDPVNGSVEWHRVYDFGYDSASAVVDVDSTGNPIMVGYVDVNNDTDESYLAVTKISKTDGSVTWSRKLDGQADEQAYGMAVGPNNEVVAVGYMSQLGATDAAATVYADPVSNVNWVTGTGVSIGGFSCSISVTGGVPTFSNVVDTTGGRTVGGVIGTVPGDAFGGASPADDMVVKVGTISYEPDDRIVVVKYNSSGAIQWQRAIQFDSGFDCSGADADIDSQGNVYICGQYEINGIESGMALIKFNSAGVKQWSRRVQGDCISVATSIVVGPDDKLYISGVTGNNFTETFIWVVAKYSLDGLVEWQRFMENTTTWSFSGQLFNNLAGGSNLAVRQDYVALSGGFGNLADSEQIYATLVQVPATGGVFTVGNWDFRAADLSGVLNSSASDITVIDAGLTDSDNAGIIEGGPIVGDTEVGNFLIGTLFTAPGGNNSLVSNGNQLILETTGAVTLPQGGTITEGVVTSNPTIQLTPASPSDASQKLVIKGGGSTVDHHLHLTTGDLTETSIFLGTDDHNVRTTLNGNILITTPDTVNNVWQFGTAGTITLPQGGVISETAINSSHSILLTPYAAPQYNPDMAVKIYPTFNDDDHIHITAGNPATVDLFLGDDDQYVKIEADGGNIVISADDPADVKWTFGTDGKLSKLGGVTLTAGGQFNICTIDNPGSGYTGDDPLPATTTALIGNGTGMTVTFGYGTEGQLANVAVADPGTGYVNGDVISVDGGTGNFTLTQYNVLGNQANSNFAQSDWTFSPDGKLIFPNSTVQTTAYPGITTVAKTGAINPGIDKVATVSIEPTYDATWVNSYSVSNGGFSCDIVFPSAGNPVFGNIVDTVGNRTVGATLATVLGSALGITGVDGVNDMVIKVATLTDTIATALDLTKSVNKLTDGVYTLANGVEGQIMYLVAQNGVVPTNVSVLVANSRNIGVGTLSPFSVYDNSDDSYYDNIGGICTLIFTDGAWQQSGGAWGTPT